MSLLSIIVPCLNEEEALPFFYEAIRETIGDMQARWPELSFELLFIDDQGDAY